MLIGGILNSALYLAAVFIVGIVEHRWLATRGAVAAFGVTYLSYFVALGWPDAPRAQAVIVWTSIALGAMSGLSLLV